MTEHAKVATREQIAALQSLYSKWEAHTLPTASDRRAARLAWASENVGHPIASFLDLTRDEARGLIDVLKGTLGQPVREQPRPWRRIRSRERAHAAGTAGRHGAGQSFIQMASPDDYARIDEALRRLGWTREQYEAWLQSSSSPLPVKKSGPILTVGEANKVWWALKAMLQRSGRWLPGRKRSGNSRRGPHAGQVQGLES
jgi:hypothetical protein